MAILLPFRAVRPSAETAHAVVTQSYERYTPLQREEILKENPESWLHIINPGFREGKIVRGPERRQLARERYSEFLAKGILVREPHQAFYLYEVQTAARSYLGILGAASSEDYRKNVIKRHEETLAPRELLFSKYLEAMRFNAEPVLLVYPDHQELANLVEREGTGDPSLAFDTPDGHRHRLWTITSVDEIRNIQGYFAAMDTLYIADGHHRSASSNHMAVAAMNANKGHTGREAYNYFMSYLLPESAIGIKPYHRMVRDLNGHSTESFLMALSPIFDIRPVGKEIPAEVGERQFGLCLKGACYILQLRESEYTFRNSLDRLDSQILYSTILRPILGIDNLRDNHRLAYAHGTAGIEKMLEGISRGEYAAGFTLKPPGVTAIKEVAEQGLVMPPKSTYIEPKLLSGLAVYEF